MNIFFNIRSALHVIGEFLVRPVNYLNDPAVFLNIQRFGLYLGTAFFAFLFLYMIYLRPNLHSLDFAWTWIIGSIALLFASTILIQERPGLIETTYIVFAASLIWINCILSVLFTIFRFIFPHRMRESFGNKDYSTG